MSMWLRQSTASQEVLLGPFVDSTDGVTAETGLTIANTDIKLWVEGATAEANKNSGGATHIASGRYYAVLDATDTATLGKLEINVAVAGALPVRREFMVVPAMIYDSMILGTDRLDTNVTHAADTAWASGAITAASIASSAITSAKIASGAITSTGIAANAIGASQIAANAITSAKIATDAIGAAQIAANAIGASELATDAVNEIQAAVAAGSVASVVGSVGSVTGAVGSVTGNVGGNVTGSVGSVLGGINTSAGTITTLDGLDTAQDSQHATTQASLATAQADLDTITGSDGVTLATTQPNYAPNTTTPPTVAAIADAVWDEATAGHVTAGTYGVLATDVLADTAELQTNQGNWLTATGFSTHDAADVRAEIDSNSTQLAAIVADTNELQTDWVNGGRLDLILDTAAAAGSGDVTSILGTSLTETSSGYLAAAFKYFFDVASPAKTVNDVGVAGAGLTQADVRTAVGLASANLDTQLAAIVEDTGTTIPDQISGLNNLSASDVATQLATYDGPTNAEMVAAFTEIKGATWSSSTDTLEALRDRGDAAWVTGGGGSAADIADAVWDELLSGHVVSGSAGEALAAAGTAGDPWITALPGAYGAGTAGYIVGTNLDAVSSAIKAKTDLITSGSVSTVTRVSGTTIDLFVGETHDLTINTDDYTGKTLQLIFETTAGDDVATIADGAITKASSTITFTVPAAVTTSVTSPSRRLQWALRDTDGDEVLLSGPLRVISAAF